MRIQVSWAAARSLGVVRAGTARVEVRALDDHELAEVLSARSRSR